MEKDKDKRGTVEKSAAENRTAKPQEKYGFYFSSSVTIKDPATGKVLLRKRCN
jgi:hypothetical protein